MSIGDCKDWNCVGKHVKALVKKKPKPKAKPRPTPVKKKKKMEAKAYKTGHLGK